MAPNSKKRKAGDEESEAGPSNAAADVKHLSDAMQELQRWAECTVCCEPYSDPRVLPGCDHTLCYNCAEQLIKDGKLKCPACRKESAVPTAQDLRRNLAIADMITILNKQLEAIPHADCSNCKEATPAEVSCPDCDLLFCKKCSDDIHKMKAFDGHEVQAYKKGVPPSASLRSITCPAHPHAPVALQYCSEKQVEFCPQCVLAADHAGHAQKHISIIDGAAQVRAKIADALAKQPVAIAEIDFRTAQLESALEFLKCSVKTSKDAANYTAKAISDAAENARRAWLLDIDTHEQAAASSIARQLDSLKSAKHRLQESASFAASLSSEGPLKLIRQQDIILSKLQQELQQLQQLQQLSTDSTRIAFDPEKATVAVRVSPNHGQVDAGGPVSRSNADFVELAVPWQRDPACAEDELFTDDFFCRGWAWRLQIFPKGNGSGKGSHVSVFLLPTKGFKIPEALGLQVKFHFTAAGITRGPASYTWTKANWEMGNGYPLFITIAESMANLRDGKLHITVKLSEVLITRL
eukprot:tig00001024_g6338.t1